MFVYLRTKITLQSEIRKYYPVLSLEVNENVHEIIDPFFFQVHWGKPGLAPQRFAKKC